jgi:hypothetical protein
MVTTNLNLNNFSGLPILLEVFGDFDNNYEYTAKGIFRRKASPFCPKCNSSMVHNGYNICTKKGTQFQNLVIKVSSHYIKFIISYLSLA